MTAARCFPHLGGVERHVEAVRQQLVASGCSVDVIGLGIGLSAFRSIPLLVRRFRTSSFDVVHAHDFVPVIVTALAQLLSGARVKVFATMHGYEGYPIKKVYVLGHRVAHAISRRVIAIGSYIDQWYGTRSNCVVHGGVEEVKCSRVPQKQCAVFVSRLAPDTNCVDVVRAFVAASNRLPDVDFRVFGFGPSEALVQKLCDGTAVRYCGPTHDVFATLDEATVVVANSYLAAIEALSTGRAVITFCNNPLKYDYMSEMAQASGAVAIAQSQEDLARLLVAFLENDQRCATLGARGAVYASRFLWRNVADDYLNLWRWAC